MTCDFCNNKAEWHADEAIYVCEECLEEGMVEAELAAREALEEAIAQREWEEEQAELDLLDEELEAEAAAYTIPW